MTGVGLAAALRLPAGDGRAGRDRGHVCIDGRGGGRRRPRCRGGGGGGNWRHPQKQEDEEEQARHQVHHAG